MPTLINCSRTRMRILAHPQAPTPLSIVDRAPFLTLCTPSVSPRHSVLTRSPSDIHAVSDPNVIPSTNLAPTCASLHYGQKVALLAHEYKAINMGCPLLYKLYREVVTAPTSGFTIIFSLGTNRSLLPWSRFDCCHIWCTLH